jgi:uroporphyrinogen III methyltransferase/synthase
MSGRVVLVGAGPGDPDLLTLRAVRELERADVVMYDALLSPAILGLIPRRCERIDVGKRALGPPGVPQSEIATLMIEKAREGRRVVRLKGGDPFVFGRGGEEASALFEAGIPFEVVPGVSAALAAPAYAGIPLTDRRLSSSFAVLTGHRGKQAEDTRTDWESLARSAETLVVLMGTAWLEDIVARVIRGGRDPRTPAAVVASATGSAQRVVTAPLAELSARAREAGLRAPTVVVIGEVVRLRESLRWYELRPLFSKRVLVLRSESDQGELCARIAAAGAEPIAVPLLTFEPLLPERELDARLADAASSFDWIALSSAVAARMVVPRIAPALREPGARARIACVGPATAEAVRGLGLQVALSPARPGAAALARALCEAGPKGARVLFPCAEGARSELEQILSPAGFRLELLRIYRTALPEGALERLREVVDAGVDAVLLTSPSTVERVERALGAGGLRRLAASAALVCIGATTEASLRARELAPAAVAARASSEGLLEALEACFAPGPGSAHAEPERIQGGRDLGRDRSGAGTHPERDDA